MPTESIFSLTKKRRENKTLFIKVKCFEKCGFAYLFFTNVKKIETVPYMPRMFFTCYYPTVSSPANKF